VYTFTERKDIAGMEKGGLLCIIIVETISVARADGNLRKALIFHVSKSK
jgi:hypothetical protein